MTICVDGPSRVHPISSLSDPEPRVRFRYAEATGEFPPPRAFAARRPSMICGNPRNTRSACALADPHRDALRAVRSLMAIVLAVLVLGGVLAFVGEDALRGADSGPSPVLERLSAAGGPASTPVAEWKRGSMPYVYQIDPAWADEPYAGGSVGTHGCGPACMSMVSAYLTGKKLDPVELSRMSESEGFVDSGATSWRYMTDGAAKLGLVGRELPASSEAIRTQLRMGHPLICIMGPGDFTTEGHFIVLCSEEADGTIQIRDPNSQERSEQTWDLDGIMSQCLNIWAFSV